MESDLVTIRSNPKYQNICWVRVGMYRNKACEGCSKKDECDNLYNERSGEWHFRDPIRISKPRDISINAPPAKIKIRKRKIPLALWQLNTDKIKIAVDSLINENGAIYSDDLVKATDLHLEVLVTWLKHEGFAKRTIHSKRWESTTYTKS